jgi:hypothetical protein
MRRAFLTVLLPCLLVHSAPDERPLDGFGEAVWGMSPSEVRAAAGATQWTNVSSQVTFPAQVQVTAFSAPARVAGYPSSITYYFVQDKFFQATVKFDFSELVTYDFNYNVYRSVDEYYRAIHGRTVVFVRDIYDLLRKKYGKREPVFDKLDPRRIFADTDEYLRREQWNLRYNPYEYYKRIACSAFARWTFPKTLVSFSVAISAADKRFDYILSLASSELQHLVNEAKDAARQKDL